MWADQRKGKHKGSVGIAMLLQAQTIDLSATDSSLIVPSGFALLCERRGVGKHFWEDRALTRAFPWAGRMNAVCVGNTLWGTGREGGKGVRHGLPSAFILTLRLCLQ